MATPRKNGNAQKATSPEQAAGRIEPSEEQMQAKAKEVRDTYGKSVERLIEAGGLLRGFEEKIVAGTFKRFVEHHLKWKRTQVYRLMWAYDQFHKCRNLERFEISAIYKLAAPKSPQPARDEALQLAAKGEFVSHQRANELVAKYAQPNSPAIPRTRSVKVDKTALQEAAKARKIDVDKLVAVLRDVGINVRWEEGEEQAA